MALPSDTPYNAEKLAECYRDLGRADEVERVCSTALFRFPEHVPFMRLLYLQYSEDGRHSEALALARQAVSLAPDNFGFRIALGYALEGFGRHKEALAEFREALRLAPGSNTAIRLVVTELEQTGREREIPGVLEEQAQVPNLGGVDALFLGIGLYERGHFETALRLLKATEPSMSHSPELYVYLARTHRALGFDDEAIRTANNAVQAVESMLEKLPQHVSELRELNDRPHNRKGIRYDELIVAHYYREAVEAYSEADQPQKAQEYLERLATVDPEKAETLMQRIGGHANSARGQ